MPQRKVKVTYFPAEKSPSQRAKKPPRDYEIPELKTPQGLSPLAAYLEENADSGLSRAELIEQFQEYDCTHRMMRTMDAQTKTIDTCEICGLVVVKEKKIA